ncbi:MAG: chromosome segregation protein SMC [Gemmatimonadota bacterium]|nr:chromosome segregation protein SMC [Gemmatimonadota bacterium]
MKLRSINLRGFKSFADATVIDFHQGITAIVGPNGCGKSNISDAIRWVLGEQRPSAIRGGKMEEAIFQGSLNRRPVNRGAVSMVVTNEDGALPVSFTEVEIGRTVYRDGGSDYSLNRSTCRLRDVLDMCRDTGLGANAYSVIENRMIDAILSDRAEERRQLFEEASGVGKYKDRRKAALRRMERAETDLTRLEDLIGEVKTKVRSLARQKGKAERYGALRTRRLSVEVAVVRNELDGLHGRLEDLEAKLSGTVSTNHGMIAQLRASESKHEKLRLEEVSAERDRAEKAAILDQVRNQLVQWERDLAVAEERRGYIERRLVNIGEEREVFQARLQDVTDELVILDKTGGDNELAVAEVGSSLERQTQLTADAYGRLDEARRCVEEKEHQERDLVRKGAQLEGDAEAADGQAAELERRIRRIDAELSDTSNALSDLESQGDLFATRVDGLEDVVKKKRKFLASAKDVSKASRTSLEEARKRDHDAAKSCHGLAAEVTALRTLEEDQERIDPVGNAVLALDDEGVVGSLLDFMDVPAELGAAVEGYLGTAVRSLVVRDSGTIKRLAEWFSDEWKEGGGLILLPLDCVPESAGGSLLEAVQAIGEGAPWVEALLGDADLVKDGNHQEKSGRLQLALRGKITDSRGIVRIGAPWEKSGRPERPNRLETLEISLAEAEAEMASTSRALSEEEVHSAEADSEVEVGQDALLAALDELRQANAEVAAQVDRRARIDNHRDELVRQLEGARAANERTLERVRAAKEDREVLSTQEGGIRTERRAAQEVLTTVQDEWEEARVEESQLEVRLARAQAVWDRIVQRRVDLAKELTLVESRLSDLNTEEGTLDEGKESVTELQEEGLAATEQLFSKRDEAQSAFDEKNSALAVVAEALSESERAVRKARSAERASVEKKHSLEMERQEVVSRIGLIQERLESEWGRPLEDLLETAEVMEGDPEELKAELDGIVLKLERIGLVNMLAVEEHEEETTRLTFLSEQREDLVAARDDLKAAIRQINQTAIGLFETTFERIRENFKKTFSQLFEGGEADIWLSESEDPLESPIEIHASPMGKKTQRIDLLSGGERALTALSLLFGIYLVKPSPFCVLDEVDAPLDENNIGRFVRLLQEFKEDTQFVLITHNPRSIEAADWIYGVTMEEPGVSTIVGVQLQQALEASGSAA